VFTLRTERVSAIDIAQPSSQGVHRLCRLQADEPSSTAAAGKKQSLFK